MKVPKHIIDLIKAIEQTGYKLQTLESELYSWLQQQGINVEDDTNNNGYYIDMCLEFLLHNNDGTDLIKYLESYKKEQ